MKLSTPFLTFISLATANFNLLAARSGSAIHLRSIEANGGSLWIGKPKSDYCPPNIAGLKCPNTTGQSTTYGGGGELDAGRLGLGVIVPGGQEMYVTYLDSLACLLRLARAYSDFRSYIDPTCGRIGYTRPHSVSKPMGAYTTGWTNSPLTYFGILSWQINGTGSGVVFCPEMANSTAGPWQAHAVLDGVQLPNEGCLGADLISSENNQTVWEYTG
jgi:hypothetical protein